MHTGWDKLLQILKDIGKVTLAYSGGIDSRFLAHATRHAGVSVQLVHLRGPHVSAQESAFALEWAESMGFFVQVLTADPLGLPAVAEGDRERCYSCKRFLFEKIASVAQYTLCDGSNVSDCQEFRPGRRALQELGVRSPLAEAGFSKEDIRHFSRQTGLAWPEQPSKACLLTRLPYGVPPDAELLRLIALGESAMEDVLAGHGFADISLRLRMVEPGLFEAHLSLAQMSSTLEQCLSTALQEAGFIGVRLVLMDKVSGYFDQSR